MSGIIETVHNAYKEIVPKPVQEKLKKSKIAGQVRDYLRVRPRKQLGFEVPLADHCNLNCAHCSYFAPLAGEKFLDTAVFEKDIEHIAGLTGGRVRYLRLLGGEPLLHPRLIDFFNISRKYFKNDKVEMITNGILLLKQPEEFWRSCKENNIVIKVTRYPIKLDWQSMEQKAKSWGIRYEYTNTGTKTMFYFPFDLQGNQNGPESFAKCTAANNCVVLYEGKLATCFPILCVKYFNNYFKQNLEVTEGDYIDIYKVKDAQKILDFLHKPIPFCKYCNVKARKFDLPWGNSKKDISEWA
jgi:MoaA/NifB/PqqE/SkfB family radical SAM enzyme